MPGATTTISGTRTEKHGRYLRLAVVAAALAVFVGGSVSLSAGAASGGLVATGTNGPGALFAQTADTPTPQDVAAATPSPTATPTLQPAAPSVVQVTSSAGVFTYLVNGEPQVIHGMGMNTQYASEMTPDQRHDRLEADMAELQAMGVNTLVGWTPAEFDDMTLAIAQEHGIGVVMPFDVDPTLDFTSADVRGELTREVLAWVQRYQSAPALRMWGLGNEVLRSVVHPTWQGPQDPAEAAQARAFSDWLVDTADAIHVIDPNHPVTYRDAEGAFTSWVADSLRQKGGVTSRVWFVYGTNVYQEPNMEQVLTDWPKNGMGGALWVSEFAPGGLAIPDRPAGFQQMWSFIQENPNWVLGGAVYAWTRNGPEQIDQNLGLTDDGTPADGDSLNAISDLFNGTWSNGTWS